MKTTLVIFLCCIFAIWFGIRIVAEIQFDRNCEGYLKRAADANTVELAKQELEKALRYIEERGLTTGYTSVIYRTPDEDIGFWYNNISQAYLELLKITDSSESTPGSIRTTPQTTALEKSNVLMKLRETLLDRTQGKDRVTHPSGISVYPYNTVMFIFGWLSFILMILSIVIVIIF